jgi:hypothetical protein
MRELCPAQRRTAALSMEKKFTAENAEKKEKKRET